MIKNQVFHNRYVGDIVINYHKNDVFFVVEFDMGFYRDERFLNIVKFMYDEIKSGDEATDILDIGGHIGTHAILYSKMIGDKGKVHVFEPQEKCREILNMNIMENKCENIIVNDCLIGDKRRECRFPKNTFVEYRNEGDRKVISSQSSEEYIEKQMMTIDEYCETTGAKPKIIKLDIETFENPAIYGAQKTIEKYKPFIYYENIGKLSKDVQNEYGISDEIVNINIKKFCIDKFKYRYDFVIPMSNVFLSPPLRYKKKIKCGQWRDLYNHHTFIIHLRDMKNFIYDKVKGAKKEFDGTIYLMDYGLMYYDRGNMFGKTRRDGNLIHWFYPMDNMWANCEYWNNITG
jgi:FkbM family methyltransferase